jgi:hypothetical protein
MRYDINNPDRYNLRKDLRTRDVLRPARSKVLLCSEKGRFRYTRYKHSVYSLNLEVRYPVPLLPIWCRIAES